MNLLFLQVELNYRGVWLEGKNWFLTPTEKIETVWISIFIPFESSKTYHLRRFRAVYTVLDSACGGELSSLSGNVKDVNVQGGTNIKFNCLSFDLKLVNTLLLVGLQP